MILGRLSLISGYLSHWLHAVNQHSLHAPLVYSLYTELISADEPHPDFEKIEALRQDLLHDQRCIRTQSPGAPSQVAAAGKRKISHIARHGISSPKLCRLLYRLARYRSARHIVELGTSLGITTLYLSAACPDARIYTLEGCTETAALARRHFKICGKGNIHLIEGNIDEQLPLLLSELPACDFAFMDANHRYEPTINYYYQLYSRCHEQSLILLDDIYWSFEMMRAWQALRQREEVSLSLDLFDAGLLFFHPSYEKQHHALMF